MKKKGGGWFNSPGQVHAEKKIKKGEEVKSDFTPPSPSFLILYFSRGPHPLFPKFSQATLVSSKFFILHMPLHPIQASITLHKNHMF